MSELAISIEAISKKYQLGGSRVSSLSDWVRSLKRREERVNEEFWALRDISFDVKGGEAVGIIGKNGAGKSTLLKILSRITHPTLGRFEMTGRVSSLLEVGTGFHPELSGRENIFLNGTILGMSRSEIKFKFDEIVEFSDISKFIDTPVKHYSSGMYVRLAFSVAAHLEPEILIIDEVLAVGDAEFQNKCLGKMNEVTQQGRTVLFVSHNLSFVKKFCSRGVFLESGHIKFDGFIDGAIQEYRDEGVDFGYDISKIEDRIGEGSFRFNKLCINNKENKSVTHLESGSDYIFQLHYSRTKSSDIGHSNGRNARFSIAVSSFMGPLFNLSTDQVVSEPLTLLEQGIAEFRIPKLPLAIGSYYLTIFMESDNTVQDSLDNKILITVNQSNFYPGRLEMPAGWSGFTTLVPYEFNIRESVDQP